MYFELIAGLIVVLLVILWYLRPSARVKKYADKIPGPKPSPIVGNALSFKLVGQKSLEDIQMATRTYGKIFRLWMGPMLLVMTSDFNDVQMILSSINFINKGYSYRLFDNWLGTGLITSSDDIWHKRRKAITPTFHFKILEDFLPVFNKCSNILIDCLNKKTGQIFNVVPYTSNVTLDVITESAMGIQLDAQTKPISEYVESLDKMNHSIGVKFNNPWLSLEPFYTLSGWKKADNSYLRDLLALPREVMAKKRALNRNSSQDTEVNEYGIKKRIPFLERLLHIQRVQGVPFETEKAILDEVTTFMFAGYDTVATALHFTIWELAKNPEIQEKLYQEVSSIVSEHPELRMEDLNEMKYIERVIKESLRMYPPVTLITRSINEDTTFPSGYIVPAGSEVVIPIFLLHWNPEIFPEPFKFNPDRFLEDHGNPYVYIPFSAGPRNCIGQKYAMLELKVILSKLVYNYKIKSEGEIILEREIIFRSKNGINITLTKR